MDQAQPRFAPLTPALIRRGATMPGRRAPDPSPLLPVVQRTPRERLAEDVRLFVTTYVVGLILFTTWLA